MFSLGSTIKDGENNLWIVAQTWIHDEYLCVVLTGAKDTPMEGRMGGARFKQGDAIFIRPRFTNTQ